MDFAINGREMGTGTLKATGNPLEIRANVAAMLPVTEDPALLRLRPASQKPYWHLERARIAGSRRVPVELIVNGEVAATQEIEADGQVRPLNFRYTPKESSWIALRILGSSHTNPIWVEVAGAPVRVKSSVEWCLRAVEKCRDQKLGRVKLEEQGEMLSAYEQAAREYRTRLNP
jgi:hypothetical protein